MSILKEIDNLPNERETKCLEAPKRASKRVSFSRTNFVKEFGNWETHSWNQVYEQQVSYSSSSSMEVTDPSGASILMRAPENGSSIHKKTFQCENQSLSEIEEQAAESLSKSVQNLYGDEKENSCPKIRRAKLCHLDQSSQLGLTVDKGRSNDENISFIENTRATKSADMDMTCTNLSASSDSDMEDALFKGNKCGKDEDLANLFFGKPKPQSSFICDTLTVNDMDLSSGKHSLCNLSNHGDMEYTRPVTSVIQQPQSNINHMELNQSAGTMQTALLNSTVQSDIDMECTKPVGSILDIIKKMNPAQVSKTSTEFTETEIVQTNLSNVWHEPRNNMGQTQPEGSMHNEKFGSVVISSLKPHDASMQHTKPISQFIWTKEQNIIKKSSIQNELEHMEETKPVSSTIRMDGLHPVSKLHNIIDTTMQFNCEMEETQSVGGYSIQNVSYIPNIDLTKSISVQKIMQANEFQCENGNELSNNERMHLTKSFSCNTDHLNFAEASAMTIESDNIEETKSVDAIGKIILKSVTMNSSSSALIEQKNHDSDNIRPINYAHCDVDDIEETTPIQASIRMSSMSSSRNEVLMQNTIAENVFDDIEETKPVQASIRMASVSPSYNEVLMQNTVADNVLEDIEETKPVQASIRMPSVSSSYNEVLMQNTVNDNVLEDIEETKPVQASIRMPSVSSSYNEVLMQNTVADNVLEDIEETKPVHASIRMASVSPSYNEVLMQNTVADNVLEDIEETKPVQTSIRMPSVSFSYNEVLVQNTVTDNVLEDIEETKPVQASIGMASVSPSYNEVLMQNTVTDNVREDIKETKPVQASIRMPSVSSSYDEVLMQNSVNDHVLDNMEQTKPVTSIFNSFHGIPNMGEVPSVLKNKQSNECAIENNITADKVANPAKNLSHMNEVDDMEQTNLVGSDVRGIQQVNQHSLGYSSIEGLGSFGHVFNVTSTEKVTKSATEPTTLLNSIDNFQNTKNLCVAEKDLDMEQINPMNSSLVVNKIVSNSIKCVTASVGTLIPVVEHKTVIDNLSISKQSGRPDKSMDFSVNMQSEVLKSLQCSSDNLVKPRQSIVSKSENQLKDFSLDPDKQIEVQQGEPIEIAVYCDQLHDTNNTAEVIPSRIKNIPNTFTTALSNEEQNKSVEESQITSHISTAANSNHRESKILSPMDISNASEVNSGHISKQLSSISIQNVFEPLPLDDAMSHCISSGSTHASITSFSDNITKSQLVELGSHLMPMDIENNSAVNDVSKVEPKNVSQVHDIEQSEKSLMTKNVNKLHEDQLSMENTNINPVVTMHTIDEGSNMKNLSLKRPDDSTSEVLAGHINPAKRLKSSSLECDSSLHTSTYPNSSTLRQSKIPQLQQPKEEDSHNLEDFDMSLLSAGDSIVMSNSSEDSTCGFCFDRQENINTSFQASFKVLQKTNSYCSIKLMEKSVLLSCDLQEKNSHLVVTDASIVPLPKDMKSAIGKLVLSFCETNVANAIQKLIGTALCDLPFAIGKICNMYKLIGSFIKELEVVQMLYAGRLSGNSMTMNLCSVERHISVEVKLCFEVSSVAVLPKVSFLTTVQIGNLPQNRLDEAIQVSAISSNKVLKSLQALQLIIKKTVS